jgi:hypothetical protein
MPSILAVDIFGSRAPIPTESLRGLGSGLGAKRDQAVELAKRKWRGIGSP